MNDTGPRIGFLGIGLMGEGIVRRLLQRGRPVTVWNLEPERLATVLPHGAVAAASPAAIAESCDVLMMCVLDTEAVRNCIDGPAGVASAKRLPRHIVDHSTIEPDATRDFARRMKEQHGVAWIDAPVSGGPAAAHSGTMTILVGGEAEAFASVRPVLDDLGRNITHLGPSGSGQIAKIVNQAIVGVGYMLMAEAVALAEAAGLDASRVPACLAGGMADSTVLQRVFPQMQQRDFAPPRAYARQLAKDQKSVLAFAAKLGLDLPVVNGAAQRFVDYAEAGNAMQDPATILRLYTAQTAWRS